MRALKIMIISIVCIIVISSGSYAGWLQDQMNSFKSTNIQSLKSTSLSETKIADGLKEALKVGIDNTVKLTGKTDGFFKNDAIKIPIPEKLQMLDKGLRAIGMNKQMDDFVLSMNRAAEAAAPQAKEIFINSIMGMSFDDVMKIYKGGDTSATNFLKDKASSKLREAFSPFVKKTLSQYDVTSKYNDLVQKYRAIPFSSKFPVPDVEQYVMDKSLNGLFMVLGQEELKIRTQPAARVTSLLKEVFK